MKIPYYTSSDNYTCEVLGFRMCQNRLAVPVLSYLIETGDFKRVIELGTHFGGLSALLGLQCQLIGATLDTFDLKSKILYQEWLDRFKVRSHLCNVFSKEGTAIIQDLIEKPGRVLMLCDNGAKVREVNLFAPMLKPGDVIGAHDYHPAGQFNSERWGWQEISDQAIAKVCEKQNLAPFHQDLCTQAAWVMKVKIQ